MTPRSNPAPNDALIDFQRSLSGDVSNGTLHRMRSVAPMPVASLAFGNWEKQKLNHKLQKPSKESGSLARGRAGVGLGKPPTSGPPTCFYPNPSRQHTSTGSNAFHIRRSLCGPTSTPPPCNAVAQRARDCWPTHIKWPMHSNMAPLSDPRGGGVLPRPQCV